MESNTPTPYQRTRRAARYDAPPQESPGMPQQAPAQPPVIPAQPVYPPAAAPAPRVHPVQPAARRTEQTPMYAAPEVRRVPAGDRPRPSANQRAIMRDDPEARRAARTPRPAPPEKVKKPEKAPAKVPSWMWTLLSLMTVGVMALVAFSFLMQAWLKTNEDEKQAAHEAILFNYHVTEAADGTLRVTWQDLIEKYADLYNLDPAFVTAVIRNESSFRTNAESGAGARGLMQMMPDTAEWVAGKLDEPYDFDRLYEAETSIRYGCWYLNYLATLFRGDPVLVCAAYHAGQGEVWSWLDDPAVSPDGVTVPIDRIPISNTKTYAGRVTQAYGIYKTLLYPETSASSAYEHAPDGAAAIHILSADR